jgi:hypothetical protein
MRSVSIFKNLLVIAAVLVVTIFFLYPTSSFPFGLEALECLLSFIALVIIIVFTLKFQSKLDRHFSSKAASFGLWIGLLWTIEISVNNFIRPGLPLRDTVDDIFWGLIACAILYLSIADSFQTNKISIGIKSGFFSGLSSGAVACLTALLLICFGMPLILKDPLNIKEWTDLKEKTHYPNMAVYFAYQTLAGAMLHLMVLGGLMGLLLGIIGGMIGRTLNIFGKIRKE